MKEGSTKGNVKKCNGLGRVSPPPPPRKLNTMTKENNNGWINIKSEEDLPKECGNYHIVVSGIIYVDEYNSCTKEFSEWFNHAITHYQPIVKPLPPIY